MSFKVEAWLADNCDIKDIGIRFLLFSMANQASHEGKLLSKNSTYVKLISVSERTIQRWTKWLVDHGWIVKIADHAKDNGRQLCNVYQIVLPWVTDGANAPSHNEKLGRVTSECHPPSKPSLSNVTLPATSKSHPPDDTHAVTPIRNQTDNHNGEPKPPLPPVPGGIRVREVFDEVSQTLWRDHQIQFSAQGRRSVKHRIRAGETAAEIIQHAVAVNTPRAVETWEPPEAAKDSPAASALTDLLGLGEWGTLSAHSFTTWFAPLIPIALFPTEWDPIRRTLVVAFPSRQGQDWCERNYFGELTKRAHAVHLAGIAFWRPDGPPFVPATT